MKKNLSGILMGLLVIVGFAVTASCAKAQQPGTTSESINVSGVHRTYLLHRPTSFDRATTYPLVFVLHGLGGNAKGIEKATGMSDKADAEKFIVVYPNGLGDPAGWDNGIGANNLHTADDVGFLTDLLDKLEHNHKIDQSRVYFCGFSAGAIMSYRMGASLGDRIAAIGIASGTVGFKLPNGSIATIPQPVRPLPVIAFHGKKDTHIYYNGGGLRANDLSVADSIKFWLNADNCDSTPQVTTLQNGNLIRDGYHRCKAGVDVVLYSFGNGTHEWPTQQNNDNFSATDTMWEFFVRHPKS
jgi:polyhydroxybutyrate depolymerase